MASILAVTALLLFVIYAGLIIYYRQGWQSLPFFDGPGKEYTPVTKITVIIPARNEETNIGKLLDALVSQHYPEHLFEVIVVDDHSTDKTAAVVKSYSQSNIQCLALQDFVDDPINSYKKKAIEVAIARATGDLVLTTDADCSMGPEWLRTIACFYETEQPAFIAAPVSIRCGPVFLEMFQALDFMTLQGITGASVNRKLHSMCNGANLAYEKKVFYEVGGFTGIDTIASGDDMLLMHKISQRYPDRTRYLKSAKAIVYTEPASSLSAFLNQRIRWASKADKYDDQSILPVLIAVYFFNVLLLVLPLVALFNNTIFTVGHFNFSLVAFWFFLMIFKTLVEMVFLFPVANFFRKKPLLWLFPLMQPFHIIYTIIAGWLGKFGTYQWKGRKVK
jgi:cellulose synthase/poly-beta-1,6-N-acetylglucosamine synthase-like glycosyltransferase